MLHLKNGAVLNFRSEYFNSPLYPVLTSQSFFHLSHFNPAKDTFTFEGNTNISFFPKSFLSKLRSWNGFLSYNEFFFISGEVKERRIQRLEISGIPIEEGLDSLFFSITWGVCYWTTNEYSFFKNQWPKYVGADSLSFIGSNICWTN